MINRPTLHFLMSRDLEFKEEVLWVLGIFSQYAGFNISFKSGEGKIYTIGESEKNDLRVNPAFFYSVYSSPDKMYKLLNKEMNCVFEDGTKDFLSTAFYFLNCLWERDAKSKKDHWGRSDFDTSIWKDYGHDKPFVHVNNLFDELAQNLEIEVEKRPATIFLSHDIDVVYGAWLEDGKAALKKGKIASFLKMALYHFTGNPQWFNFMQIAKEELKFGFTSTFFWIPIQGKIQGVGRNADYALDDLKISKNIKELEEFGFSNGIHKSISNASLDEEVKIIKFKICANRYHYLKFNFEDLIDQMELSGLKMDASLGYAQISGFRNGYSLPFVPFNLKQGRPSYFVEVPLVIMDGTFSKYLKMDAVKAEVEIDLLLRNYQENAVVSILWHNSHFTDFKYKGFLNLYRNILHKIHEQGLEVVNPDELIDRFILTREDHE